MTEQTQVLTQQIQKLRALHAQGVLGDDELHQRCAPLERQLVDLVLAEPVASPLPARVGGRLALMLAGLVVSLGAAGYLWTGSPGTPAQPFASRTNTAAPLAEGGAAGSAPEISREQILAMSQRLADRLKETPDDVEGWRMLGRTQMALEQPELAVQSYQRVVRLQPQDAGALADYADALAVRNGRELKGEPTQLIEQALKLDPQHMKSLILAGTAAYNRGDYTKAVVYWDRAGQIGPADNPLAQQARAAAAEAREAGKLASATTLAPASAAASVLATGEASAEGAVRAAVSGTVSLVPALRSKVAPTDTVFIVARPADGSRMPLAIVRKQVSDLPYTFTLDDSQAMSPASRLSTARTVIVVARISKSGQASTQAGDLEGLTAPVAVGSKGLAVEISREVAGP